MSDLSLSRRRFITGLGLALAAPAIVRVESLMKLPPPKRIVLPGIDYWHHGEFDEPTSAESYLADFRDFADLVEDITGQVVDPAFFEAHGEYAIIL